VYLGDVIAQHAVEKRDTHDYARTLRLTGFGGIVAAPLLSNWYKFLDRHIQMSSPVKGKFNIRVRPRQMFNASEVAKKISVFYLKKSSFCKSGIGSAAVCAVLHCW
jgi:hypothetical protein